jgi:O-antigen ligase
LEGLRDVAPYFYLSLIIPTVLCEIEGKEFNRSFKIIENALKIHVVWVFLKVTFLQQVTFPMVPGSSSGVRFFEIRGDFDPLLCTFSLCIIIFRVVWKVGISKIDYFVLGMSVFVFFRNESRAALIGSVVTILFVFFSDKRKSLKVFAIATLTILLVVIPSFFIAENSLPIGLQRLNILTQNLGDSQSTSTDSGAAGTALARLNTWQKLLDYSFESKQRAFFGVGPGENFMITGGAANLLINNYGTGNLNPRAPHNFWLNTLLRFGLLGLVIILVLAGKITLASRNQKRILNHPQEETSPLQYLSSIFTVGIMCSATLGVILESPFGAIPFAWFAGLSLNNSRRP